MGKQYKGAGIATTITGSLTNVGMSASIAAATGWATTNFWVVIDPGLSSEEKVFVASRSGTTLTFATRGADDTSAVAHNSGAVIRPTIAAADFQAADDHLNTTVGAHGGLSTFQTAPIGGFYGIPGVNLAANSRSYVNVAANKIYYMPIKVDKPITISELALGVKTAVASAKIRVSIYNATTAFAPGTLVADVGELDCSTIGKKALTGLTQVLAAGLYLLRIHTNANCAGVALFTANYTADFIGLTDFVAFVDIYSASGWSSTADFNASLTYGAAETPGTAYTPVPTSTNAGVNGYLVAKWTVN